MHVTTVLVLFTDCICTTVHREEDIEGDVISNPKTVEDDPGAKV